MTAGGPEPVTVEASASGIVGQSPSGAGYLKISSIRARNRELVRNAGHGVSDGDEPMHAFLTASRAGGTDA